MKREKGKSGGVRNNSIMEKVNKWKNKKGKEYLQEKKPEAGAGPYL